MHRKHPKIRMIVSLGLTSNTFLKLRRHHRAVERKGCTQIGAIHRSIAEPN